MVDVRVAGVTLKTPGTMVLVEAPTTRHPLACLYHDRNAPRGRCSTESHAGGGPEDNSL